MSTEKNLKKTRLEDYAEAEQRLNELLELIQRLTDQRLAEKPAPAEKETAAG